MNDVNEALRNIDVFCRVLVKKLVENENTEENNVVVDPMESLLRRKYIIEGQFESQPLSKYMIPLPHLEEPLIDIFEDDNYVKILVECRCEEQKVIVKRDIDGLQVCKRECYLNSEGQEICVDKCQKLSIQVENLRMEDMITKCINNAAFEINIPKTKIGHIA
ncbi:MAG: hypothetical protein QXN63_03345 [Candidatus Bathyarchaeia archaeon]